jgi:hypothetical protein
LLVAQSQPIHDTQGRLLKSSLESRFDRFENPKSPQDLALIRWPFRSKDVLALSTLLMMTQMWLSLLTPHDWDRQETIRHFVSLMAMLMGCWIFMILATLWLALRS